MSHCAADDVRQFILDRFAEPLSSRNLETEAVPDDFDLLGEGLIDSLGLLELINAVENNFGIEVDFDGLDPEQMTLIGPFCRHVEQFAILALQ